MSDIEERSSLLPQSNPDASPSFEQRKTASSYAKIGIAMTLAVAALMAISTVPSVQKIVGPNVMNLAAKLPQAGKYDNAHGPNGEVYCNELGQGECLERIIGYCTKHGPCEEDPNAKDPTEAPTSAPSSIFIDDGCNPEDPPCKEWFLGICTLHYHCHEKEPCDNEGGEETEGEAPEGPTEGGKPVEPKEEPPAEEPKEEPPAEEPRNEPPAEEPRNEPPTEEPRNEPPAEEPKDEPPAEEPKDEPPADEPPVATTGAPVAEPVPAPASTTDAPVADSTRAPKAAPTRHPRAAPSARPSRAPKADPTRAPVVEPTAKPSTATPSEAPVPLPSAAPVADPTLHPILRPSSTPTPMPSSLSDCNPEAPPCLHDFLGICYDYQDCGAVGNHDSYPYTTIVHEFSHTHYPTLEPTPAVLCDPEHPPCVEWWLGQCIHHESCENLEKAENATHTTEHHETTEDEGPSLLNVTSWGEDTDKPEGNSTETTEDENTEPDVKADASAKIGSSQKSKTKLRTSKKTK